MTSVERVVEYTHLEPEAEPSKPIEIPPNWPQNGVITAVKLYYSHHKSLPFVLKNLNFEIRAEEKVSLYCLYDVNHFCTVGIKSTFSFSRPLLVQ